MQLTSKIIAGACAFLVSALASAMPIMETTDAGETLADAVLLPTINNGLVGQIDNDVDLFGFTLASDLELTISATSSDFDMNLVLFNGLGQGLAGNDDLGRNGGCDIGDRFLDSCLNLSLAAGDYFVAIGANNVNAFSVGNNALIGNDSGILAAPTAGTLASFTHGSGGGEYRVTFGVPVPAPATVALVVLALAGVRLTRR